LIESVDSALRLLHMFLVSDRIRVSEAAVQLGVAASTAHRLLAMLQYHGFVAQDRRTHEYLAGPDLIRFGLAAAKQVDFREQARPVLEELSAAVNETVHLGILQGTNVLYLESIEGSRLLRIGSRGGASITAHCVSMGKAMLAALARERIDELYPDERIPTLTPRSIATKTELLKQLALIRKRGYATSSSESDDGVTSVAMAIYDGTGEQRAAMSIAAPSTRAVQQRIDEWVPLLRKAAEKLGRRCH
jgi:IclR family acetate operon transcriptional repressor